MKSPLIALLAFGALLVSGQGNATTTKEPVAPSTTPPPTASTTSAVPSNTTTGKTDAPQTPTTAEAAGKLTDAPQATTSTPFVSPENTPATTVSNSISMDLSGKSPGNLSPPSPPSTTKAEEASSGTTMFLIVGCVVAGVVVLGLFGYLLCTRRSVDDNDDEGFQANVVQTVKSGMNNPSSAAPSVHVLSPEVDGSGAIPGVSSASAASSRPLTTQTNPSVVDVSATAENSHAHTVAPVNNFETEAGAGFFTWQNSSRQMVAPTTAHTTAAWPTTRQSWTSEGSSASKPNSPSSSISNGAAARNLWGAASERTNSYASVDHDRLSYGGSSYGSRQSVGSFLSDHDSLFTPLQNNPHPRFWQSSSGSFGKTKESSPES